MEAGYFERNTDFGQCVFCTVSKIFPSHALVKIHVCVAREVTAVGEGP